MGILSSFPSQQLEDLKNELEKRQEKKKPEFSHPETPAERREEKNRQLVREFSRLERKKSGFSRFSFGSVPSGKAESPEGMRRARFEPGKPGKMGIK